MNIRCAKDSLLQAISATQRVTPSKPVVQALSGILIDAENNFIVGTDLEISTKCPLEATVVEKGATLVSGRYILEIIKSLPGGSIELKSQNQQININSSKANFILNTLPVDEFPDLSIKENSNEIEIEKEVFLSAINHVTRASAKDDVRPILTGVLLKINNDELEFAATDSYRLAVYKTKIKNSKKINASYIIPYRALDEVAKLILSYECKNVKILTDENQATFKINGVELTTRLLEGSFPNYNQLIPEEFLYKVDTKKADFLDSIKRSSIITEGSAVKLKIGYSQIETSSINQNIGSSLDVFDVKSNVEELEIAFNPQYITDGLNSFNSKNIELNLNEPSKPVMMSCSEEKDFFYIIMPMRVT